MVAPAQLTGKLPDRMDFGIGVLLLADIQDAHVYIFGLAPQGTDNPETKQVGSGVDA